LIEHSWYVALQRFPATPRQLAKKRLICSKNFKEEDPAMELVFRRAKKMEKTDARQR
jgi:hypothetical protein